MMRPCSRSPICPIGTLRRGRRCPSSSASAGWAISIGIAPARKSIARTFSTLTIHDLKASAADHIAVTGDLVNLSLPDEYNRARGWLQTLGSPRDVTLVPGNHDIYVRSVQQAPAKYWADYMRGDDGLDRFPFLRRRGNVALIGLSTALPTAPLLATGRLGKRQLARLLGNPRSDTRLVPHRAHPSSAADATLSAAPDRCRGFARRARRSRAPSFCCTATITAARWSGSTGRRRKSRRSACRRRRRARKHGDENAAGYNLFRIDGTLAKWSCEMIARERDADGTMREVERQTLA